MCAGCLVAAGPFSRCTARSAADVIRTHIRSCIGIAAAYTRSLSLSLAPYLSLYLSLYVYLCPPNITRVLPSYLSSTPLKKKIIIQIHTRQDRYGCRLPTFFPSESTELVSRLSPEGRRFKTFYFWHVAKRRPQQA